MHEHDVMIVGGGTGLDVATVAYERGLDVAIIDDGPLGGTCLNRGCIPSKMLIHRADLAEGIRDAERFGIDASIENVDFAGIVREVNEVVEAESRELEALVEETEGLTRYPATARFVDERTVRVGGETVRGETVVVAAGARPVIPPIDGIDDVPHITSTGALRLEERPDELVIVGGGYVAAELGHFFGALGTDVTVIVRGDAMLSREDDTVSEAFTSVFGRKHDVHVVHRTTAVETTDGRVTVHADGSNGELSTTADVLLVAAGVRSNADRLDVAAAGIETDDRGYVTVDEYLRTSADGVWALGDVIGRMQFKHASVHEAGTLVANAFEDGTELRAVDYSAVPHAVFSSPQVAAVGRTEQELADEGIEHAVRRYDYADVAMGRALKETDGFVKVLADPEDGTILGCHIVGPDAPTLVHEVVVAMRKGGTIGDVGNAVHVHPALSEVVQRAFAGEFRHHPAQFHLASEGVDQ